MEKFINASILKEHEIREHFIEKLISKFNVEIEKNKSLSREFIINTVLNDCPTLSQKEFEHACNLASKEGWILTSNDDNYLSTTYKLIKK